MEWFSNASSVMHPVPLCKCWVIKNTAASVERREGRIRINGKQPSTSAQGHWRAAAERQSKARLENMRQGHQTGEDIDCTRSWAPFIDWTHGKLTGALRVFLEGFSWVQSRRGPGPAVLQSCWAPNAWVQLTSFSLMASCFAHKQEDETRRTAAVVDANCVSFLIWATHDVLLALENLSQWDGEANPLKHNLSSWTTSLTHGCYIWIKNQF